MNTAGHEIAGIFVAAIVGVVIVSAFSPQSSAGTVISQSLNGFSNLISAIGSPMAGQKAS